MLGKVVSNKMTKAIVVEVKRTAVHPKYGKRYIVKKKYAVACSDSTKFPVGHEVSFIACAPVSKTIKFKVEEAV
jgi:ribosomal protein S17